MGCADASDSGSRPLPSILLITVDTTRADHLGAYGYERATSPTLDRMASEGVLVERAITTMPTTDPAHLSILTGQYPRTHGVRQNGVPAVADLQNLASWARASGRRTAAFVSRQHVKPSELGIDGFEVEDGPDTHERAGGITLARARAWRDAHEGEPWFLWVHFFDPHAPYHPPRAWRETFEPEGGLDPEQSLLSYFMMQYDSEIAYMDSLIARLWKDVREEEPLIIVAGDHGEIFGELWERHEMAFGHGKYLHGSVLHVPLLFWWGERLAARRVPGLTSVLDVPATLFDILDEEGFETRGVSFHADEASAPGEGRVYAFSERREYAPERRSREGLHERQYSVRDRRHSLILSQPAGTQELYDLVDDPTEQRDVFAARPDEAAALRQVLDQWLDATPDVRAKPIDPTRIEALRALGYVE